MPDITARRVNMYDLLVCLTNAEDLISPALANHHQQVAYLSLKIAEQAGLPVERRRTLVLAGLLHDVGALSLDERLELLKDETLSTQDHARRGAKLLGGFPPLHDAAELIRYHHLPWDGGKGASCDGKHVPTESHILHLADRVAVAVARDRNVIDQMDDIRAMVTAKNGTVFAPKAVEAFLELSRKEYIWLDLVYHPPLHMLPESVSFDILRLDMDMLIELTKIFSAIIDFRSPFTANHSAGVAATAAKLASLAGFSETECKMMLVAGYLHDLGKLAVKNEILEKPARLDEAEFNAIRSHTFYTYRLLQSIRGFEVINKWASFHHEKLNGKGYPFHLKGESLPLGSRIMAVADIFTAVTEDRPYRTGMTESKALSTLRALVDDGSICPYVVSILTDHFEEIDRLRREAQEKASQEYRAYIELGT